MHQAFSTARLCSPERSARQKVVDEIGRLVPELDISLSPPENAVTVYGGTAEVTGVPDLFRTQESCSEELKGVFAGVDRIFSKGQDNFETLFETEGPVAFLLTVKCPVVARHLTAMRRLAGGRITGDGEMILMYGGEE